MNSLRSLLVDVSGYTRISHLRFLVKSEVEWFISLKRVVYVFT